MFYATMADRILETIDGMEIVETAPCMLCGMRGAVELTADQCEALDAGGYIQDVAPDMSPEEREQFISGTHPECWTRLFG